MSLLILAREEKERADASPGPMLPSTAFIINIGSFLRLNQAAGPGRSALWLLDVDFRQKLVTSPSIREPLTGAAEDWSENLLLGENAGSASVFLCPMNFLVIE